MAQGDCDRSKKRTNKKSPLNLYKAAAPERKWVIYQFYLGRLTEGAAGFKSDVPPGGEANYKLLPPACKDYWSSKAFYSAGKLARNVANGLHDKGETIEEPPYPQRRQQPSTAVVDNEDSYVLVDHEEQAFREEESLGVSFDSVSENPSSPGAVKFSLEASDSERSQSQSPRKRKARSPSNSNKQPATEKSILKKSTPSPVTMACQVLHSKNAKKVNIHDLEQDLNKMLLRMNVGSASMPMLREKI